MDRRFNTLIEQQIAKARAEGKLSGLEGEGKPLPRQMAGDMAMEIATRIMAEAGAVPEEFKLKKMLDDARAAYKSAEGDEAKRVAMALIADLEQRFNVAVEARRKFMR